ncbi:hypothetical protein ACLOJK_003649 [Asimina triloba]
MASGLQRLHPRCLRSVAAGDERAKDRRWTEAARRTDTRQMTGSGSCRLDGVGVVQAGRAGSCRLNGRAAAGRAVAGGFGQAGVAGCRRRWSRTRTGQTGQQLHNRPLTGH